MATMKMTPSGDQASEVTKLIAEMKINAPTMMAANKEPGRLGIATQVQSNIFGMLVEDTTTIYVYDIRIFADLSPTKTVEFTKKAKDDCLVNERRQKCVAVVAAAMSQNASIFPDPYKIYYDGQSMMFSASNALTDEKGFLRLSVPGNTIPQIPDLASLEIIVVEIKSCSSKNSFVLSPERVANCTANRDISANDRFINQFMEIAVNQYATMNPQRHKTYEYGKSFMTNPLNEGLTEKDLRDVGDGKQLMVGSKKSVRQIEGPRARNFNNCSVVIDAKKTAFHKDQGLVDKILAIIRKKDFDRPLQDQEKEKVGGVIKGLFVETTHLKNNKRIQIYGLSKSNSIDCTFDCEGAQEPIDVSSYFRTKYNIQLKAPLLPLILAKERGNINCYPMEVLRVVPFQRVTIPQQTPEQSQQSTRDCAVAPSTRQEYIIKGATALELLGGTNKYMQNVGLRLLSTPLAVAGRQLPPPAIKYNGGKTETVELGKWKTRGSRYIIPAHCNIWAVYCIQDSRPRYNIKDIRSFAEKFFKECKQKGMEMTVPADIRLIAENELEATLQGAGAHGCEYALFLVADTLVNVHKAMKYYERKFEVITQQVKLSNVEKIMVENKFQTLENIINKTNLKIGGLNYGLELASLNGIAKKWFAPERLVIGVAISHPPPSAAFSENVHPSVVGYAANFKANPYEFVGDFLFQESKKADTLNCMGALINTVVERHAGTHKGIAAKEVIIYRNGIDEGSYELVLKEEIPSIKAHLVKAGHPDVKITFIVVAKTNSDVRLFKPHINPADRATQQNIAPANLDAFGIVVDTQLTHPSYNEFYMNSHTTLQGSAKSPRYTILYDELDLSNDEIQGMTYALAHNHQIVAMTTSLPANLYIANRYAERGAAVWAEFNIREESKSESSNGSNFEEAHRLLTYKNSKIGNNRVNA